MILPRVVVLLLPFLPSPCPRITLKLFIIYNGDRLDALKKEREYLELFQATLNQQVPSRTMKEWAKDNKDQISDHKKEYYQTHKDKIQEYITSNRDTILETKKAYREAHPEKSKEYYQNNKDKSKEYYGQNKDTINTSRKEKIVCICGASIARGNLADHKKSNKHKEILISI